MTKDQEILQECYVSVDQTIFCSEKDMNSQNRKTCSLCQKESCLVSEMNGLFICWSCYWKNYPHP